MPQYRCPKCGQEGEAPIKIGMAQCLDCGSIAEMIN